MGVFWDVLGIRKKRALTKLLVRADDLAFRQRSALRKPEIDDQICRNSVVVLIDDSPGDLVALDGLE